MNKPQNWYGFMVKCELHDGGLSNMTMWSQRQYCSRKNRQGKDRPKYDSLKCHWNVCPKLKKHRKVGSFKGWDMFGKEL